MRSSLQSMACYLGFIALLFGRSFTRAFITGRPFIHLCRSSSTRRTTVTFFDLDGSKKWDDTDDDCVLQLPLLHAQLAIEQDPEQHQELLRRVDHATMAGELGVRRAQIDFYDAFSNQDLKRMSDVWAVDHDCQCIHPGMESIHGRSAVLESWEFLFQAEPFQIEPTGTTLDICGSTAICRCVEKVGPISRLEAINIYKRENGRWRMTLHMASPMAVVSMIIDQ